MEPIRDNFWKENSHISGVMWTVHSVHQDARGTFAEAFRASVLGGRNISQVNVSTSRAGVMRGMHFHNHQTDYWYVAQGIARIAIFDPAVNMYEIRRVVAGQGIIIPATVAHGFFAVTDFVLIYGVTREYDHNQPDEYGFHPYSCGIKWEAKQENVTMSQRDREAPRWK